MFDNVRQDIRRACAANQDGYTPGAVLRELGNPGTQAVLVFRLGAWIHRLPALFRYPLKVLYFPLRYFFSWRVGIFIPVAAEVGPGLVVHTWGGGIFLPSTKIGKNLTIVGGGVQMDYDTREIGDDVSLGPGTKVVGRIRIGHRARTGPNSVAQADVPDDCVVFGNPGRIIGPIRRMSVEESQKRIVPATTREPDQTS